MGQATHTPFPVCREFLPAVACHEGRYEARFAQNAQELDAILRLRFDVFNLELDEGLANSFETGRDQDEFDSICHHLAVVDTKTDHVVGCYRMQTAAMAQANRGFYSDSLFDLGDLPAPSIERSMEVGRACIAKEHRNSVVLFLLWKGLATYVARNQIRYLFGCCSLTSQDSAEGWATMRFLEDKDHIHPSFSVIPRRKVVLPTDSSRRRLSSVKELPILFRTYLRYGSKVCGPPAIDREFKTIDFFVVLDVDTLSPRVHRMFFG